MERYCMITPPRHWLSGEITLRRSGYKQQIISNICDIIYCFALCYPAILLPCRPATLRPCYSAILPPGYSAAGRSTRNRI